MQHYAFFVRRIMIERTITIGLLNIIAEILYSTVSKFYFVKMPSTKSPYFLKMVISILYVNCNFKTENYRILQNSGM